MWTTLGDTLVCAAVIATIFLVSCTHGSGNPQSAAADGWHEFQGTWIATGNRSTMRLQGDRRAAISSFDGSLLLAGASRPGVGFRSDAIVFSDTLSGMIGRAVWTDEHGDQIFSELRGEGSASNNKIVGTFVGGTGRYSGATGTYDFSWRFLIENEDGDVQGQSVGLTGRVRVGSERSALSTGGSQR